MGASTGLLVTRAGQRGGWFPLPYDDMGSVYERADALPRLSAVLELLMTLEIPLPSRLAVAARIEPVSMLQRGVATSVGGRTTAQFVFAARSVEPVSPEDTVSASAVVTSVTAMTEEIIARLEAKLDRIGR